MRFYAEVSEDLPAHIGWLQHPGLAFGLFGYEDRPIGLLLRDPAMRSFYQ